MSAKQDLIDAYHGRYCQGRECDETPDPTKWERQIRRETPYQRLDTFLRWHGISGYTDQIFSIATGKTK